MGNRHSATRIVACALLVLLAACSAVAQTPESQKLHLRLLDAKGKAIPAAEVGRFHCRDMADEPLPIRSR